MICVLPKRMGMQITIPFQTTGVGFIPVQKPEHNNNTNYQKHKPMKKNYYSPQLRCFHLQGGSPMFREISVNPSKTSDDAGWSKKFWGLAEDDEEDDSEFPWE